MAIAQSFPTWWVRPTGGQFTNGGYSILEMPWWGMAQNKLGTTAIGPILKMCANVINIRGPIF